MPNGEITNYRIVIFRTTNSFKRVTLYPLDSPHNLTDLESFTRYSIIITAHTIDYGEESSTLFVMTQESGTSIIAHPM